MFRREKMRKAKENDYLCHIKIKMNHVGKYFSDRVIM